MTSRRKSLGRAEEADGSVLDALASRSMSKGERVEQLMNHRFGTPRPGKYSRRLGGEYGSSVSDLQ